jgi:N-acetylmuramoyl-L-alanine amidase
LPPAFLGLAALVFSDSLVAAESIRAVRVWPAQDYTRVTLESGEPLKHSLLLLKNPERLALDLTDVDLSSVQQGLEGKVAPNDPHIASLRVGQFKPGIVRVVFDLKTEAKPQIFTLPPIGHYGHRLVLDIYPIEPFDPILTLLQKPGSDNGQPLQKSQEGASGEERAADPDRTLPKPARERPAPTVNRLVTIVIDPGHGGEDPGARGRRGTYEKKVTLTIARKLKALIDVEPHMRALLTRDGDFFIKLDERVEKARRVNADLFVSIHADAVKKPSVRGSSIFALSERGATSKTAQLLAERENTADLIGGVSLEGKDRYVKMTLADLSLTAQISDSLKLGRAVLGELGGVNLLHKQNVEQAGFAVLKAPDVPSILIETAFISNPDEERRLNDAAYQEKVARAILRGIKSYVAKNPPLSRSTLAALP